MVLDYHSMNMI